MQSRALFVGRGCSPPPDTLPRQGLMPCTLGLVRGTFSASAPRKHDQICENFSRFSAEKSFHALIALAAPGGHAPGPPDGRPPSRLCYRAAPLSRLDREPADCGRRDVMPGVGPLERDNRLCFSLPTPLFPCIEPMWFREFPRSVWTRAVCRPQIIRAREGDSPHPPLFFGYFLSQKKVT